MLGHNETGNETYVLELVRAFAQLDTSDTFYVYVENPDALPAQVKTAPHMRVVQYTTRSGLTRLLHELALRAEQDSLDILHISYNAPLTLPPSCALVVTIHDISFEEHSEWFPRKLSAFLKWSVPRSARKARAILTDTESAKQDLVRLYRLPPEKITVTPYAAHSRFQPATDPGVMDAARTKYDTSDQFVLAVSNMQPRKNLSRLMRAFMQAKQNYTLPHKLVLVGQPLWSSAPLLAEARALGSAVVVTGYVPDADLPLLYNAADVFCYPSLYEGFGLPVLEAMACGAPVITSNASSLPEVAGTAARMVNPYDIQELACALGELLTDAPLRAKMRADGLAHAGSFSWQRTAQQTLQVYHRTAPAPRTPSALSPTRLRN